MHWIRERDERRVWRVRVFDSVCGGMENSVGVVVVDDDDEEEEEEEERRREGARGISEVMSPAFECVYRYPWIRENEGGWGRAIGRIWIGVGVGVGVDENGEGEGDNGEDEEDEDEDDDMDEA